MKTEDFNFISRLLKMKSGIVISEDKTYLVDCRLTPLSRKLNFASLDDLLTALKQGVAGIEKQVIDAMTTNESLFFRDIKPFDLFRNVVMPYLLKTRADKKRIRIWSNACSSGQEAYSLCMILKDFQKELEGWTIDIVGTDLSTEIINKAKSGLYTQFEVQRGLPIQMLIKHFTKVGEMWQINPEIRDMVQYKEFNLLSDFSSLGFFDVVFCRNVLLYFGKEDKVSIFDKISKVSNKDCFLFLGGAETIFGFTNKFKALAKLRGIYISSLAEEEHILPFIPSTVSGEQDISLTPTSSVSSGLDSSNTIGSKIGKTTSASSILSTRPAASSLSATDFKQK